MSEISPGIVQKRAESKQRLALIAGFDDLSYAPYLTPALTSVRLPFEAMGAAAVAWLLSAVRGQTAEPLRRRFPPELIVRQSSAG